MFRVEEVVAENVGKVLGESKPIVERCGEERKRRKEEKQT